MTWARSETLKPLKDKIQKGEAIKGGRAGAGISAGCGEAAGIDLIVIYTSARHRIAGRGSLAGLLSDGNAHRLVKEMA